MDSKPYAGRDFKHVTFFLENGTTLRFNEVTNFRHSGSTTLTFYYVSKSDGLKKYGTFDNTRFIGISYCE